MARSFNRRRLLKRTLAVTSSITASGLGPTIVMNMASALEPPAEKSESDDNVQDSAFSLKYLLGSCMFGTTELAKIIPEVAKTGATALDIWPKPHGAQREQLEAIGEAAFAELLGKHNIDLGCITRYDLGPFGIQNEMRLAKRLGCKTIVTGGRGPANVSGKELKTAVRAFVEQLRPHLDIATETGVTVAIENHGHNLINSPDSMRWLMEMSPDENLGIALAPYHLPQDATLIGKLIRDLGNRIAIFYAWQHGMGCMKKLPKEQELLQLPGRGDLDFAPLLAALRDIDYQGWTEIFMHPVPRGIPILEATPAVTAEINTSRSYLEAILKHG